ncbi:MAG TPA: hypothetical protein VFS23_34985 [Vicinamibacterales bacterium]|nr:hypothetical protein [Vicinamibacterales bacterium]
MMGIAGSGVAPYTDAQQRRRWATNLLIVAIGLVIFAALNARSGRVEANDGLGWDGRQYAHMVTGRVLDGTVATQTRPLLPLLTRIPYYAGFDVISAFQVMNVLYAAALYFFLCLLLDLYDVAPVYKAYFVVTVALCIATAKMFAFYPTLIDLGALAALSGATYVVLTRDGWAAGAAALVAVFARELGIALAFFGIHRDLRQGRGVIRTLLTYAPALVAMFLVRQWAAATNLGDRDRALLTAGDFIANLALWLDPGFVAFFFYFLLTLIGGVTLLLVLRPGWCARRLLATPELATFAAVILAATAVGNADIWRYLAFLLPVITILYAGYVRDHRPGAVVLSAALLVTLVTQQPFSQMDMTRYFRDWFPVYVARTDDATPAFWSTWRLRMILTAAAAVTLGIIQWTSARSRRQRLSSSP